MQVLVVRTSFNSYRPTSCMKDPTNTYICSKVVYIPGRGSFNLIVKVNGRVYMYLEIIRGNHENLRELYHAIYRWKGN